MTNNENSSIFLRHRSEKYVKKISFCFLWVALYKAVYFHCVAWNALILLNNGGVSNWIFSLPLSPHLSLSLPISLSLGTTIEKDHTGSLVSLERGLQGHGNRLGMERLLSCCWTSGFALGRGLPQSRGSESIYSLVKFGKGWWVDRGQLPGSTRMHCSEPI